jgi:hypothetical protein
MRILKMVLAFAALGAVSACNRESDAEFLASHGPLAHVRFVNAVSDSGAGDWRFVDQIEDSPVAFGLRFRDAFPGAGYQALGAGSRHLRIFQTSTDIVQTQKVFFDTTFNFEAGKHYTLIAAGTMRDRAAKLYILTDDYGDPGSQFSLRVFNTGAGTVDVYTGSGSTNTPLAPGLANFTASTYKPLAVGPMSLRAFPPSSTTSALVDVALPAGLPADRENNLTAVGGSTQAGSALTAFIFPRSVAGSNAQNFTTPGVLYIVDRYPPSGF